jgi:hypothetical protein
MSGTKPVTSAVRKILEKARDKAAKKAEEAQAKEMKKQAEKQQKRDEYLAGLARRAENEGINMQYVTIPDRKTSYTKLLTAAKKKRNAQGKKVTNATRKGSYMRRVLERAVELGVPQNKIRGVRYLKNKNVSAHAHSIHGRYLKRYGDKQTKKRTHESAVRRAAVDAMIPASELPKVIPATKTVNSIIRAVQKRMTSKAVKNLSAKRRKSDRNMTAIQKSEHRRAQKATIMAQTGLTEEAWKKIVCSRAK